MHLHAVIRLDAPGEEVVPPPPAFGADMLLIAVRCGAGAARVAYPPTPGVAGEARWGDQLDLHVVGHHDGPVPAVVAAYISKYATKSTDPAGLLDHRVKVTDLAGLEKHLSPHLARMVRTTWDLGGRAELADLRLRAWAHTLGFRGHWLTKSRAYSTTFGALRAARHDWHTRDQADHPSPSVRVADWRYAGRGWSSAGDAWLAETAGAQAAATRRLAREERRAVTGSTPARGAGDVSH